VSAREGSSVLWDMDYLRQPGFLEGLSEYERTRLGQICPPNTYRRGDYLFRAGSPS